MCCQITAILRGYSLRDVRYDAYMTLRGCWILPRWMYDACITHICVMANSRQWISCFFKTDTSCMTHMKIFLLVFNPEWFDFQTQPASPWSFQLRFAQFWKVEKSPLFSKKHVYLSSVDRFTLTNQRTADALDQIPAFQKQLVLKGQPVPPEIHPIGHWIKKHMQYT